MYILSQGQCCGDNCTENVIVDLYFLVPLLWNQVQCITAMCKAHLACHLSPHRAVRMLQQLVCVAKQSVIALTQVHECTVDALDLVLSVLPVGIFQNTI